MVKKNSGLGIHLRAFLHSLGASNNYQNSVVYIIFEAFGGGTLLTVR